MPHLSSVIAPYLVLKFLMDRFVASSSWIVNGEFVSKKWSLIKKKERQTRPLISGLFSIPPRMTGTRKGVVILPVSKAKSQTCLKLRFRFIYPCSLINQVW